ncbi:MAG: ATP-binding protein [Deltaproteobacteria bacterium]|nr:ATP-binding protein [Myxococcales bacterium]MDP3213550.1 ATP-binding protein [Deltaproteobacteria bacterium]
MSAPGDGHRPARSGVIVTTLAEFIVNEADAIAQAYGRRPAAPAPPGDPARVTLLAELPELLSDLARSLGPSASTADVLPRAALDPAKTRPGGEASALLREYGILRDCIYERLEASSVTPTLGELRALSDRLSVVAADAVERALLPGAALQTSEARYRTLFASIDDGFCLIQMLFDAAGRPVDYRFLDANAAFAEQTGLRDAVGHTARALVPDLDASWFELYGRVAMTGETARFENHAAAMGRWFDVYASRVGSPELRQLALVFKDITRQKRAEEERERLLAAESAARRQAEDASRLKDEFLATVSHELRTPLTSMLGWVQILRAGRVSPDRRDHALATIERNARAQAQLIEDLLDVSRILAGKLRLEVEPVEVRAIVEAALETVRPAADAKAVNLTAALSEGVVMGDPQRLQQVVWNLLSNAVKFTPRGGRVEVLVARRDSSVDVTVADTGQGIAPEFQAHVFERFRQADGGSTRVHGGLGLGLSIVRQLVEMHGGTVTVASEGEGLGSSFTARLPVSVAPRPSLYPPRSGRDARRADGGATPPELVGLGVLVVDDDADTREMLRALLEAAGARVRVAPSMVEGLRAFHAERPDVLVSDIGMPDADGHALIRAIRAMPPEAGGAVPAIAVTAYARTQDRADALRSGFDQFIPKPVEPLEFLTVVATLSRRAG